MTPEQLKQITELRSRPLVIEFVKANVDVENGVLRDVVMVQEGEASGHDVHLEGEFIADLVAYDKRVFGADGIKSRFGHVFGLAAMGAQLGYFRNVRKREKNGKMQAIGDLHLLKSADKSPTRPGMYTYVLELAQEAPDFIMSSIVFKAGRYYQRKANRQKKYIWEYAEHKPDGTPVWETWVWKDVSLGKVFVEFGEQGEHYYTDLVDDGAATDNLFHSEKTTTAPADNPKKPLTMSSIKELLFGKEKATEEVALTAEQIQELRDNMTKVENSLASAQKSITDLQAAANKQKADFDAKEKELATANARVAELEKLAADKHTKGAKETEMESDDDKAPAYLSDPATQRARQSFEAMQKNKKAAA